jgi:hypothetical protein
MCCCDWPARAAVRGPITLPMKSALATPLWMGGQGGFLDLASPLELLLAAPWGFRQAYV